MKNLINITILTLLFSMSTYAHQTHEKHKHEHKAKCGHKEVQHGDHVDFKHGKHKHKKHDGHYDECISEEVTAGHSSTEAIEKK